MRQEIHGHRVGGCGPVPVDPARLDDGRDASDILVQHQDSRIRGTRDPLLEIARPVGADLQTGNFGRGAGLDGERVRRVGPVGDHRREDAAVRRNGGYQGFTDRANATRG